MLKYLRQYKIKTKEGKVEHVLGSHDDEEITKALKHCFKKTQKKLKILYLKFLQLQQSEKKKKKEEEKAQSKKKKEDLKKQHKKKTEEPKRKILYEEVKEESNESSDHSGQSSQSEGEEQKN